MQRIPFGKIAQVLSLITISFVVCYGLYVVLVPVKPFWLDEWFIIFNIKFRTATALWGELEFMQQFPRVYLHILQYIAGLGGFSYTSLRITSYIVHILAIALGYGISARLYPKGSLWRYLWLMLYISAPTALEYFVQTKQYTMDMLMGLLGIWQMLMLQRVAQGEKDSHYILLCASLMVAPFFSYTYPMVAAPLFLVTLLIWLQQRKDKHVKPAYVLLPLLLSTISIGAFYLVDVRHVLQDKGMQNYWAEYMMTGNADMGTFAGNVYKVFLNMAAGDLFGNITAAAGLAGLIYFSILAIKGKLRPIVLYALLVILVAITLFALGKLPLGSHRLNAFAVPAIALVITELFFSIAGKQFKAAMGATLVAAILFLALTINVFSSLMNDISGTEYKRKLAVYRHTASAIKAADNRHMPLLVSPDLAYPYSGRIQADWVLRTHPAYQDTTLTVLHLGYTADADSLMAAQGVTSALLVNETIVTTITAKPR